MAVRPISVCFWGGMLIPAIRAMCVLYSSRCRRRSALALLVARIRTDHADHTLATDNFAVPAHLFHRCSNFHALLLGLFRPSSTIQYFVIRRLRAHADHLGAHFARKTMRARLRSYGVSSTVTLSPGRIRM